HAEAPGESICLLNIIGREEDIVLTVQANRRRRPDGVGSPGNTLHAEHGIVLRPVNEVGRGESVKARLQQVVLVNDMLLAQLDLLGVEGRLNDRWIIGRYATRGVNPVLVIEDAHLGVRIKTKRRE